jgi:predicted small integral membrane protein
MMFSKPSYHTVIWARLLGVILVLPSAIREWIDMLTDIASYQGNVALITKIMSYKPTLVQTVFDRSIHSSALAQIGAAGFVMMHLVLALLMSAGVVQMLVHIKASKQNFKKHLGFAITGLVFAISSYLFFFGVMAMDYFMSQLQGLDYNEPIIATLLPCGIALFYLLRNESEV